MFTVSIETVTLCRQVVSIMSASKKSDNSEGQIQNSLQTWESLLCSSCCLSIYQMNLIFFQSKDLFLQKRGNCEHQQA